VAELLEDPEQHPHEPLLRDPPPPPGYVDPLEESDVLQDPFAAEGAQHTVEENQRVRRNVPRAGAV
jgi:hypothetical protein